MNTILKLALDWTPNTIHTGIYLALIRGYYAECGLDVQIVTPDTDGYSTYPIRKLNNREVDIAMAPSEHIIGHNLESKGVALSAIATVFQKDTSCMVVHTQDDIKSPKDLDGKQYIGYQTLFEQEILKTMIQHAGGKGVFSCITPPKLSVWDAFLEKKGHVCWVFTSWEYAQARYSGLKVSKFNLSEWGIPYGYSPCLIARASDAANPKLHQFVEATGKGYSWAAQNPKQAADLLHLHVGHANMEDSAFLEYSIQQVSDYWLSEDGSWGNMRKENWEGYLAWLQNNSLLKTDTGSSPNPGEITVERFAHPAYLV